MGDKNRVVGRVNRRLRTQKKEDTLYYGGLVSDRKGAFWEKGGTCKSAWARVD